MLSAVDWKKKHGHYDLLFRFKGVERPGAALQIAGDFNDWDTTPDEAFTIRPKKNGRGLKKFRLSLPPGVYRYKFVDLADGRWCCPVAEAELYGVGEEDLEPDGQGGYNARLVLPER